MSGSLESPEASLPPPPRYGGGAVADVLSSAAGALGVPGYRDVLGLPSAQRYVVVLVDGLGLEQLRARSGYAPLLRRAPLTAELDAAFPTTTAASLACLGTGLPVGVHGLTGYDSYSPELGEAVNMLGNWDPRVDPLAWQPEPTVLEAAEAAGVDAVTVSRKKFRRSALTAAALRGGRFVGADTTHARVRAALENLKPGRRGLMYFYWDDLDKTGHQLGWESAEWNEHLEELDSTLRRLIAGVPPETTVLLTADHGMVDVPVSGRVDVSSIPGLLDGVSTTAGEPRCLQLHVGPATDNEQRQETQTALMAAWRKEYGSAVHVATREQLLAGGWFGDPRSLRPEVPARIGDVLVLPAHEDLAFHDLSRIGLGTLGTVGQHGGLTRQEAVVPLMDLTGA
ncbi:alkaline phosphatase family protein [Kocuria soli]|uniref:Alkaline phosphatase family protein n=1 Tax=Kocuria soli TaxID=2485125 RepID=A0A3N3ZRH9_9MICC|nr:nucleotide pyrophosphatase/phosphodiesterase family protein [Kocuria soli]ROZ63950.1 alkaline phosphatase family protein [Kocuria soli]